MPERKLSLSPTKINAYVECPLKYRYLYVERIGRFYYRPKPGNAFGGTLHRVLQEFHRPGTDVTQVNDLVDQYHRAWVSIGFAGDEQEREYREAGERILREYHASYDGSAARTILTEKMIKSDMGEFILSGRLDRLDEHPDGALEIVDYKSMRLSVTEEEVRDSLAMSVYQLILRRLHPDTRVFATIHCLAGGVKASVELTSNEIAEVEESVRCVATSIEGSEEFRPHIGEWCEHCDFHRLCSRQPWFSEGR